MSLQEGGGSAASCYDRMLQKEEEICLRALEDDTVGEVNFHPLCKGKMRRTEGRGLLFLLPLLLPLFPLLKSDHHHPSALFHLLFPPNSPFLSPERSLPSFSHRIKQAPLSPEKKWSFSFKMLSTFFKPHLSLGENTEFYHLSIFIFNLFKLCFLQSSLTINSQSNF